MIANDSRVTPEKFLKFLTETPSSQGNLMKSCLIPAILIIFLSFSVAYGHSILSREVQVSGDYQAIMEATADVPDHYERFAITYTYLLLNKDGSQYVRFDYA